MTKAENAGALPMTKAASADILPMIKAENVDVVSKLNGDFLEEYNSANSVRKYTRETAGSGISYLLEHDYGEIYRDVLENYIPKSRLQAGIRLWEFGCGGGMNLVHLVSTLDRRGTPLACAYGTDFSETLIQLPPAKPACIYHLRKIKMCGFASRKTKTSSPMQALDSESPGIPSWVPLTS